MKFFNTRLIAAALMAGFCTFHAAHAGTAVTQGGHLTPAEIAAIGSTDSFTIGSTTVTVLPTESGVSTRSTDGSAITTVVNAAGVVGTSRNEVLVAQIPTDTVRSQGAALLAAAKNVSYFEHMQITSVRYASFAQAVAGRDKLQAMFPKAQVSLPIEFHQRKPR
jgi:hypothetical protein